MSSVDEILKLAKQLDKIIQGEKSEETAKDILNILKSTPMNLDVLQKTRIGMTVNELRKKIHSKELQKAKDKDKTQNGLPRTESMASNMSIDSSSNDVPDSALGSQDPDSTVMQKNFNKLENSRPAATSAKPLYDDVRKKSEELLLKSLTYCEPPDDSLDPEQLAAEVEQSIYDLFGSTNEKYRAAIRSRVFNLRDKKNPDLRENVLLGMLKPSRLAKMTPDEMASKDMKELRKTMTKQAINDHQVSHESGTESDMFTCGKCRGKNCTYTQVQTRSADEPMTTFVYCRTCGNRWKFC
uniref:Transcription elongation factor n=1 Tax=Romanomermis culicivorax TaxID=13658 RepID=A0A915HZZ4_ROMCU